MNTTNAEMKDHSAENLQLSKALSIKSGGGQSGVGQPGVGQSVALYASPAVGNAAFLITAFLVHSTQFFSKSSSKRGVT